MSRVSSVDIAWAAGLYEGEGNCNYQCNVNIVQATTKKV
jgi:hypothetical protein